MIPQPTKAFTAGQVLDVPGTTNLRSTGGYRTTRGVVREGGLYRSDALHNLGTSGLSRLNELGVVRVLDLRDQIELELEPTAVRGEHIEVLHHPIFGEGGLAAIGSFHIDDVYQFLVQHRPKNITGAVKLIAHAPEGGVLVHCTAGKDRTGLVIATALAAIGVDREQIIVDYQVSEANLAGERANRILAAARARFGELDPGAIELMIGSPARSITLALDEMDTHHGGAEAMLLNNGFTPEDLHLLRTRLITPVPA